jgi:hypothetical protein
MTDLESDNYNPSDPANGNVSYRDGMAAIHAITHDGKVVKGVEVFALAYQQVGLGWLFAITKWPVVEPLYEEKKSLEQEKKDAQDCETCNTKA